jgi:hypothetical protein
VPLAAVAAAPDGLFLHRLGVPFMARDPVPCVALDLARQHRLGLTRYHPVPSWLGQPVHVVLMQPPLRGERRVRQMPPQPVPAYHPGAQGLMRAGKQSPRPVINIASAPLTAVLLPRRQGRLSPLFAYWW